MAPKATPELLRSSLCGLAISPFTGRQALTALVVQGAGLAELWTPKTLSAFRATLMEADVSHNELRDLSALDVLERLTALDASHNRLSVLPADWPVRDSPEHYCRMCCLLMGMSAVDDRFPRTKNLQRLVLSHNLITTLPSCTRFQDLEELVLDDNKLDALTGITQCRRLRRLSARRNRLRGPSTFRRALSHI